MSIPSPTSMPAHQFIITAALNLDLTFLEAFLSASLPSVNIPQLLLEYKKFLAIKAISKDTSVPALLSPSALIDQAWHAHLLHTAQYRAACSALGGSIDHSPAGAEDSDLAREKRLQLTKAFYSTVFHQVPPSQFWQMKFVPNLSVVKNEAVNEDIIEISDDEEPQIEDYHVEVRTLGGEKYNIACDPNMKVGRFKEKIFEVIGFPWPNSRLIFCGKQLEDGRCLSDYNIGDGSTVHIVGVLRGC
eukprot:GFUD01003536.1.p1 GENE.GFUD01003536.1~~GFUD01003536.1.p1  ORF type:complete len:245 (-),score=55.02 GFUD01003536.1:78-812(-)